jgi:hypothetical protein
MCIVLAVRCSLVAGRWSLVAVRSSLFVVRWSQFAGRGSLVAVRQARLEDCATWTTGRFTNNLRPEIAVSAISRTLKGTQKVPGGL